MYAKMSNGCEWMSKTLLFDFFNAMLLLFTAIKEVKSVITELP